MSQSDLTSSQIRAVSQTKVFFGEENGTKEGDQSAGDVQMQSLRVNNRETEEGNEGQEQGMMDAGGKNGNNNEKRGQQTLFERANHRSEFQLNERSPISLPSVENGEIFAPTPQGADLTSDEEENMLSVFSPVVIRSRSEPYFESDGGPSLAKTLRMSRSAAKYSPPRPASSTYSAHHKRSQSFENYASKTMGVMNTRASRRAGGGRQPTITVTANTSDGIVKENRRHAPPPRGGPSTILDNEENVENIHSFAIAMDAFQQQQQQEQENSHRFQAGGGGVGRYSYGATGSTIPPALRNDNNNAAAATSERQKGGIGGSSGGGSSRSLRFSFLAGNGKRSVSSPALDEQTHLLSSSSSAPINRTQSLGRTISGVAYNRRSANQEPRYSPNAAFSRSSAFVMTSPAFVENRSRQAALQESNPNSEVTFASNSNTNSGNPIAETNERGEIIPVLKPIHRHFGNFHSPFYIDEDEIKKANAAAAIEGKTAKGRRGNTILPNKNPDITTFDELMWSGYGMDGAAMEDAQAELSRLMDKMAKKDLLKRAQAHFERLVDCTAKHIIASESDFSFYKNADNNTKTKGKNATGSDSTRRGEKADGDYNEVQDPTRHFDDPYQYERDEEEEESEEEEEAEEEGDHKETAVAAGGTGEDERRRTAPKSDDNADQLGNTKGSRSSPSSLLRSQRQQQQSQGPPRTRPKKNFFIANALKKALTGGRGASSSPTPEPNSTDKTNKKKGHFFGGAGGYLTSGKAACDYQDPAALQKEDKYPILIQTMAFVGAALVLKYVLQTVYNFHGYISLGEIGMVFTGLFFIQGIVFGSATSDLKAAQALPGKVVVILEEMEDHFMYQSRKVLAKNLTLSYPQAIILHFADTWREYIMYQQENSYWHCELILREIVLLGALWDSKGANVGKVPELVGKLREPLSTAAFIHRSQYLPATYILLLFFVTTASILMFLVQFGSYTVMFGVTASVLTVIWFTLRLIKALENPFNVAAPKGFRKWLHGHMAAVQIFQLNEYIEKLDHRRRVQKRREKLMFTAQKDRAATKKAEEKDAAAAKMIAIANNAVASSSSMSSGGASPSQQQQQQQQSQKDQQLSNVSDQQTVSSTVRPSNVEGVGNAEVVFGGAGHSSPPPTNAENYVSIAGKDKTDKEITVSERSAENPPRTLDEIVVLGRSSRMSEYNTNTPTTSVSGRPLGLPVVKQKKQSKNKNKKLEEKGQLSSSLQQETRAVATAAVALARWRRKVLKKSQSSSSSSGEGSTDSSSDSDDDGEEEDDLINLSYGQDSRDSARFNSD